MMFEDPAINNQANLLVIDGMPDSSRASSFEIEAKDIHDAINSSDPKASLQFLMSGYLPPEQINDELVKIARETAQMGNSLIVTVVAKGVVTAANGPKSDSQKRKEGAFTILHEFIAHDIRYAFDIHESEARDHEIFFGSRDEDGNLVQDGSNDQYRNRYSPPYRGAGENSRAERVENDVDRAEAETQFTPPKE